MLYINKICIYLFKKITSLICYDRINKGMFRVLFTWVKCLIVWFL